MTDHGSILTVLNVNDDEANRYAVTRMLRLGNYQVTEASTGYQALEMAHSIRPDVVVLDVNLPDISGHEVCARIKADPELEGVGVLQLSAISVRSADKVTGLDSGADGYLTMPVEPAELLATVRALLRVRRAEEESRRAATRWRKTFEAISEGVALIDGEGNVLQMNSAMTALLRPGTPTSGPWPAVFAGGFEMEADALRDLFSSPERQMHEMPVKGRWLRMVSDPVVEDEQTGRVLTVTDLTERRGLEDDLREHVALLAETDRRKDEFLAMLAHELRNPLSAISSALYNLNQPDEQIDSARLHQIASRQVDQLSRLVDDLLDVSRITKGKIELRFEHCDIRRIVDAVQVAARPFIDARRHQLEVDCGTEPLIVNGDPTRLEQVINNLVNNAAKYTEEGGRIRISAQGTPDHVIVRVSDTGVGIAPELLPKVFDLFTQGDQSSDRQAGGLGIGLTVVRTLVQLHGGAVQASSRGLGQGSEFTIRLPRVFASVEADGESTWTRPVPHGPRALDVLVAEDNPDVRELIQLMLRRRGHRVSTAANGREAVERALAAPPDIMLVDLGLPEMDGYEVARRVRAQNADIRLIAVSGYGRDEDIKRSHEAGFERHLVKPVRPAELFAAMEG
jgi:signal transduction histidine kinase